MSNEGKPYAPKEPEVTVGSTEIFSRVTGIGEDQISQIWKEVKENQKRLKACEHPHSFDLTDLALGSRAVCIKCGGETSKTNASWYNKGLEHSKKGEKKGAI